MGRIMRIVAAALALAAAGGLMATERGAPPVWADRTVDYWNAHPDQKNRMLGLAALQEGREEQARLHFERAARYADKTAQALLAQLHWEGRGGPADQALGYAWMDLAAERGDRGLAAQRERYWAALDEATRQRSIEQGQAIYDEFADEVAQPRLERERRRWSRAAVGSRIGPSGAALVCDNRIGTTPGGGAGALELCGSGVEASVHYGDARLSAREYWLERDAEAARLFGNDAVGQVEPKR